MKALQYKGKNLCGSISDRCKIILDLLEKPDADSSRRPIKMKFGFITDRFPMDHTEESGWSTSSQAFSTGTFWKKTHSAHYCIDNEKKSWSGTAVGDDGHYSAIIGLNNVARGDQIKIDVEKVTNSENSQNQTKITVWKNNEATDIVGWELPEPVPKKLFPGKKISD